MKFTSFFVLVALSFCVSINGLKILGVVPFGSKSHFAIGHAIVKSLHDAGHDVTIISPYPQKKVTPRYRDISVQDAMIERAKKNEMMNPFDFGNFPAFLALFLLYLMGNDLVNDVMSHRNVQTLLKSNDKFDICVIENFNVDAFVGFADHFDCVLISYSTFASVKWINDMTGNEMPPSYVPHPMLRFTDNMTFMQRLENTFTSVFEHFAFELHKINQRRLYKNYFSNARRTFDEMYRNSSIIFMNQHVSSASARPLLPNMIEIGGIHVEPSKKLPQNIQEFLDSAKDGAILFSMGSIIQAVKWPVDKREALVKVFGKLKQKVIWKYENETLPNKPENVMISDWIPQRDILAHPNVKVFITHGGLLGTTEALVEGVPVVGFPVYGDQKMNMAKAVERGYGLNINLNEITEDSVTAALNEILSNEKYTKNAKLISERFNDRPMTPKEVVVYWTEHAARHRGAPHLQAHATNLNFIEFHSIDVYIVLSAIGAIILFLEYLILKFLLKKIFKRRSPKNKKD